eukprot:TRINITY_DN6196_c0_g1_i1.p1 TRINITY_DN6196_c0_g1~~TRINITY_DN6196_c0_g1_i1.p1  ORF type:complete len:578 (-),score=57.25 TRINITY_DN6196_c0_g1_i1:98-1699(-)
MSDKKPSDWSKPEVEGRLLKRGHIFHTWKSRWFRLQGHYLYYGDDPNVPPMACMDLKYYRYFKNPTLEKPFGFSLVGATPEFPDFHFSASDSASSALWESVLYMRAKSPVSAVKSSLYPGLDTPMLLANLKPSSLPAPPTDTTTDTTLDSEAPPPLARIGKPAPKKVKGTKPIDVPSKSGLANQAPVREIVGTSPYSALGSPIVRNPQEAVLKQTEKNRLVALREKYILKEDASALYTVTNYSLGKGSVGEVMYGICNKTGEKVAVKKLSPIRRGRDRTYTIMREIEIVATSQHPNIVKYYGSYEMGLEFWVVMECVQGGSLYDYIKICEEKSVYFSEAHVSYIAREVTKALEFLHSLNRIHRDIKVDNILASITGEVKLADFGTAVQLSTERLQRTTMCGTSYYMAPELVNRQPYDSAADIWSIGITLVELLDGEPPFYEMDPNDAIKAIGNFGNITKIGLCDKNSELARDFANNCCLLYMPQDRATATELLQHPFLETACSKDDFREMIEFLGEVSIVRNPDPPEESCTLF